MSRPSPDPTLLERLQNGDPTAFEELVRAHQVRLFTVAYRMLGDRDLAADVVQEAFLRIFRKVREFRPTGSFSAWMGRIVVNLCLTELERRRRWSDSELDEPSDPRGNPAEQAQLADVRERLLQATGRLTPGRQAVVALAALGYSYEEMESLLGWKQSQVKSELFRARQKLREALR